MNDETTFSRQREAEMLRQLAALRARVEELADLLTISEERNGELRARVAELEATPIVPAGWYLHRTNARQDDGGWAWSRDVAVVRDEAAQAFRALARAIEHDERPPHEGDR